MAKMCLCAVSALGAAALVAAFAATDSRAQEVKNATLYGDMGTVTQDLLNRAAGDGNNFLHTNGNYEQTRYYPNRQINVGNVGKLRPAWIFQTEVRRDAWRRRRSSSTASCTSRPPSTTSMRSTRAPASSSGTTSTKMGPITTFCCGPNNRGVAVYGDMVYMGDARRQARRARRQDRQAGLGDSEIADPGARLQRDDGADRGRRQDPDRHQRRRVRHPRLRQGLRRQDRRAALDLRHRSRRTRSASGRRTTRPAATCIATSRPRRRRSRRTAIPTRRWAAASGRTRRSISRRSRIYFVVGNPSPDLDGSLRPGDNLYTNSLVSVDLDTGKYVCHFQYIAHDVWDLDAVSPPILTDVPDKDGKTVQGVLHARQDRPRLRPRPRRLQPDPLLRGDGAAGEHVGAADEGRRAHAARRQWRRRVVADGGRSRAGAGLRDQPAPADDLPRRELALSGAASCGSAAPSRSIPTEEQWGNVTAVDYNTGKIRWQVKTAAADDRRRRWRRPAASSSPARATASSRPTIPRPGAVLWKFQAGAGVNAPPASYTVDGKQYIVVGGGRQHPARLQARQLDHRLLLDRVAPTGVGHSPGGAIVGPALLFAAAGSDDAGLDLRRAARWPRARRQARPRPIPSRRQVATCTACHGEDGRPISPEIPVISGQQEGYLYFQLRDFKSGAPQERGHERDRGRHDQGRR